MSDAPLVSSKIRAARLKRAIDAITALGGTVKITTAFKIAAHKGDENEYFYKNCARISKLARRCSLDDNIIELFTRVSPTAVSGAKWSATCVLTNVNVAYYRTNIRSHAILRNLSALDGRAYVFDFVAAGDYFVKLRFLVDSIRLSALIVPNRLGVGVALRSYETISN